MKTEVLIVGGGPAGAASALFLLREGVRPVIVEAEPFPRYHIGESMTGAGGKVVRDLGLEAEMYRRKYPPKQGVKVFGQSARGSWFVPVTGRDEHWKLFDWDTWQVRRSDFDQMLLDHAVASGAMLLQGKALKPLLKGDAVCGAEVRMADGGVQAIEADLLLDCSGQATWLANLGGVTGPKYLGAYDKQIAIFSQVQNPVRDSGPERHMSPHNTLIFYQKKYHWAWFIPLDDEVVSVGIVIPAAYFLEKKETKRDFYLRELHDLHPELRRRIPDRRLCEDVHVIPNYSYQVKRFCGKGFMCVGDAHRFIDPIFSFGLTVAMREAQFAAPAIRRYLDGVGRDSANPFAEHQLWCEKGIDILEDVLDSFWEHPLAFAHCVHARYTEYMTDMLAGRIYEHERQPSPALLAFRKLLGREGLREQSYESEDLYSIPIGSRYHPERAPIWEVNSPVETTEAWLGPR
ncbi:MAG TPA: NAD(P)/FAD-dependent oxidoreductase [Gemmatimonadales bacterium]|jgi:flavin-dependent dehydrogenase|nr:NAD(P)/FAD-dependent oxidoreductase [Gemmatimonadales bacterium]